MVVVRRMSVDGVMMMMMVVMRTSNGSLLWGAGVGREAERMEGRRSVRHLLFW
jgi:arabinogalactan endo-1,4-beta-galactosidase